MVTNDKKTNESSRGTGFNFLLSQAKLGTNKLGDRYELDADRVADQVMRMAQRQPEEVPERRQVNAAGICASLL